MKLSRRDFGRLLGMGAGASAMGVAFAPAVAAGGSGDAGRLLTGSDYEAVQSLIYRYSYTYDAKDLDAFMALFSDDAVWALYLLGATTPALSLNGATAIRAYISGRLESLRQQGIQSRHFQTNTIATAAGSGQVEAVSMLMLVWQYPSDPAPRPHSTGVYRDQFVKVKGEWKFARREAYVDQAQ